MGGRWEVGVWEWGEKLSKGRQGGMKEEEMKDEKRVGAYELNIKLNAIQIQSSHAKGGRSNGEEGTLPHSPIFIRHTQTHACTNVPTLFSLPVPSISRQTHLHLFCESLYLLLLRSDPFE
mmetsp:Transcript_37109/g.96244  ORF Transcript_37109/g.96244 Transcript_37109/m.96244 type:complete len:120 (-) Transcript_37109:1854-2213(-)